MNRNRYRIHQIKLTPGEDKTALAGKIQKKLGNRNLIVRDVEIVRESLDARNKRDIRLVYTVDFSVAAADQPDKPLSCSFSPKSGIENAPELHEKEVASGDKALKNPPVIVGFDHAAYLQDFCWPSEVTVRSSWNEALPSRTESGT